MKVSHWLIIGGIVLAVVGNSQTVVDKAPQLFAQINAVEAKLPVVHNLGLWLAAVGVVGHLAHKF